MKDTLLGILIGVMFVLLGLQTIKTITLERNQQILIDYVTRNKKSIIRLDSLTAEKLQDIIDKAYFPFPDKVDSPLICNKVR